MNNKQSSSPKKITIMSVLANGNTRGACGILKEYGYHKPKNHDDLELKLAELYRNSSEKRDLERKFAEQHPHKDLILRYCATVPKKQEDIPSSITKPVTSVNEINKEVIVAPIVEEPKKNITESITEVKSNCSGTACNCDCKSNADGVIPSVFTKNVSENIPDKTLIYGFFGIIGLLIIVHHLKK